MSKSFDNSSRRRPASGTAISERMLEKGLPQSPETEKQLLGAILVDDRKFYDAADFLKAEDFAREGHAKIYGIMEELVRSQTVVDLITLRDRLEKKGWLEDVGGLAYLASLTDGMPRQASVEDWGRIVKEKSALRRLIGSAQQIVHDCYDEELEASDVLNGAEKAIFEVAEDQLSGRLLSMEEVAADAQEGIKNLMNNASLVTGVPTGFEKLDQMTSGFHPGELIIIAGRPAMGKTSFAMNVAMDASLNHNKLVACFSLEMSTEQLYYRLLCSHPPGVDMGKFKTGFLSQGEWNNLTLAMGHLSRAPLYIDDTPGATVMDIRAKLRRLKAQTGRLDLVVIDYLQLMSGHGRHESRNLEVGSMSRGLKNLAKELDVPIVCLSQLSRAPESRGGPKNMGGHKPQLADLRESGSIEQDADVVLFLFRPVVYTRDDEDEGKAFVIIGKQRNGPTGEIRLTFLGHCTRFANPAPEDWDDYGEIPGE